MDIVVDYGSTDATAAVASRKVERGFAMPSRARVWAACWKGFSTGV